MANTVHVRAVFVLPLVQRLFGVNEDVSEMHHLCVHLYVWTLLQFYTLLQLLVSLGVCVFVRARWIWGGGGVKTASLQAAPTSGVTASPRICTEDAHTF